MWNRWMLTACAVAVAGVLPASGAIVLADLDPVVENFNGFAGTAATIPAEWALAGTTVTNRNYLTTGTSTFNTQSGIWGLRDDSALSDVAFGARVSGNSNLTLTVALTNDTGAAIAGFNIAYAIEQASQANGNGFLGLLVSTDGTTFDTTSLTGDLSTAALNGGAAQVYTDLNVSPKSAAYTDELADGDTIYFQFRWTATQSGDRPHWGIDDVSFAPIVPEPASLALLALGGIAMIHRR